MKSTPGALPLYDRTARKAHQWTMVALVLAGLIFGGFAGTVLLAIAGLIMVAGRFWWPADVARQLTWRVLEPAGILKRDDVHEDHETRRIARIIGGVIWLVAALLLAVNPRTRVGDHDPDRRDGGARCQPQLLRALLFTRPAGPARHPSTGLTR